MAPETSCRVSNTVKNVHFSLFQTKKRIIIGFFDKKEVPEYDVFRRVATNLKEDCLFYVGVG